MDYYLKYLKYKEKYINLKKQIGGNNFYFSIFVFSENPLDDTQRAKILTLLSSIHGPDITIRTSVDPSIDEGKDIPVHTMAWFQIKEFIEEKAKIHIDKVDPKKDASYYNKLINITEFQINNVPKELLSGSMNDRKLTDEEIKIKKLISSDLGFNFPVMNDRIDTPYTKGWGLSGDNLVIIALVENKKEEE